MVCFVASYLIHSLTHVLHTRSEYGTKVSRTQLFQMPQDSTHNTQHTETQSKHSRARQHDVRLLDLCTMCLIQRQPCLFFCVVCTSNDCMLPLLLLWFPCMALPSTYILFKITCCKHQTALNTTMIMEMHCMVWLLSGELTQTERERESSLERSFAILYTKHQNRQFHGLRQFLLNEIETTTKQWICASHSTSCFRWMEIASNDRTTY